MSTIDTSHDGNVARILARRDRLTLYALGSLLLLVLVAVFALAVVASLALTSRSSTAAEASRRIDQLQKELQVLHSDNNDIANKLGTFQTAYDALSNQLRTYSITPIVGARSTTPGHGPPDPRDSSVGAPSSSASQQANPPTGSPPATTTPPTTQAPAPKTTTTTAPGTFRRVLSQLGGLLP